MSAHFLGPDAASTSRQPMQRFGSHASMQHYMPEHYSSAASSSATVFSPPPSPATAAATLVVDGPYEPLPEKTVAADSDMMLEDDLSEPAFDGFSDFGEDDDLFSDDESDGPTRMRVGQSHQSRLQSVQQGQSPRRTDGAESVSVPAAGITRLRQRTLRRVSLWRSDVALAAPLGDSRDAAPDADSKDAQQPPHAQRQRRKRTREEHDVLTDNHRPTKRPRAPLDSSKHFSRRKSPLVYSHFPVADPDHVMQDHDGA
ncbi:hypothetical protein BKA62DRAFT_52575 [Auriculariales sp. MPI-PUGE-AT-0066]|nr:hypothetical protein BKA62DRAFT_52575 [Auriculariales sp. MPI-PUGE-AT-0066]